MRNPIAISESDYYWTVICDDGSIWSRSQKKTNWERMEDIPQGQDEWDKLRAEHALMGAVIDGHKLKEKDLQREIINRDKKIQDQEGFINALKNRIKELEEDLNS